MANSTLGVGVTSSSYSQGIVSTVDTAGTRVREVVTKEGSSSTNLSGDPRVLGFKHNGADRALVASYRYSPTVSAVFGIYNPATWTLLVEKTSTEWGFSNPYGLVVVGDSLYVQDYDSNKITKVDLSSSGSYAASTFYTVSPASGYTAHGNGMDYYNDGSNSYLIAVYSQVDSSYNYTNSLLVKVLVAGTPTAASVSLNANVMSVTVFGDTALVCSSGGSQIAGGNGANSKLQVVDVNASTPSVTQTITAMTSPSSFGDFVDVAIMEETTDAYVLLANYDSSWSNYTYRIIKTTAGDLSGGSFGTGYSTVTGTTSAAATWLLAPDSDVLWFVSANIVNLIDTSVDIDASGAITAVANNTNGSASGSIGLGNSAVNGYLNTASVVIEKTTAALKAAGVSVVRTKSAIRLLPLEQEKEVKAQTAAAKQK